LAFFSCRRQAKGGREGFSKRESIPNVGIMGHQMIKDKSLLTDVCTTGMFFSVKKLSD
jgi:hypothetical protein